MKEMFKTKERKESIFKKLNFNVIDFLKSRHDNVENEKTISNGSDIAKKGSALVARFHGVYEHIFYHGYDNYDKINKVAKFFESGSYGKAIRESGYQSLKEFVKDERKTIAGLKGAVDFDLSRLSKYNDQVTQEIESITKFIDENTHDNDGVPSSFKESVTEGRISELFEIKESLIHIQSVLAVTINSAIDGKRLLTVASDSVLQNISIIASIGPEDAKKAWKGTYNAEEEEALEAFRLLVKVILFIVPTIYILYMLITGI